jgi:two-component system, NtrC family, sensor kinase
MQCPRCQHEHSPKANFCEGCGTPLARPGQNSPPAASNADLQRDVDHLARALRESLEQQAATSEILRTISSSPTDVQPVLDAVAESAARLCEAPDVSIFVREADHLRVAARHGPIPSDTALPLSRESGVGWAVLEGRTVHVADMQTEPDQFPISVQNARRLGFRTALNVPLIRDGVAIGVISLRRAEANLFAERQVALLETFADQAVIAIENVRLFKELEARNAELTESLTQQTATSEVLRVISRSPTNIQPVLDAVAESAARLCEAQDAGIFRRDGDRLLFVAHHGPIPFGPVGEFSVPLIRGTANGRSVLDAQTIHVADLQTEVHEYPEGSEGARRFGHRTFLIVPLMREGVAIGSISLRRIEAHLFTDRQVALLQTFADQAVIAIENVRLFKELQAKNSDLTEALARQTATSEVLKVISRSTFELRAVLDTLVEAAARLCEADMAQILRPRDAGYHVAASHGFSPEYIESHKTLTFAPGRGSLTGRVLLERKPVQISDVLADPEYSNLEPQRLAGYRTHLGVPLLRDGRPIGLILVSRRTVQPFTDKQIELVETFADQAVIAIENVRLFTELETRTAALSRSVDQLTALGEVGRAVSSTLDLEMVLTTIVSRAVELSGLDGGVVFEYDENAEEFVQRVATETGGALAEARRTTRIQKGEGALGRTAITLEPVQVPDITVPGAYESRLRENLIESGIRAILAVPMVREGQLIGCLAVTRNQPGDFPAETIDLLRTFATQSALAIQNARLFHEIADKSRQLEAASQHKSEFLANMSHELRTPLNAIIGFSEVLAEKMFGDVNDKQAEYLRDILESGRHLLSLINDILDLSKIEAGRMELEVSEFDLPQAIQNALTLVRERALRRGIALHHVIDAPVADIRADERKVKQVLLNLLSNAIKFTPEGGRIEIRAASTDGMVEVSVADTGVGIAPEDQETVFEEFRQVGPADKKAEGTGLGLALSRKFIELHGGQIRVTSQVGLGSTFTFTLPVHRRVSPQPAG